MTDRVRGNKRQQLISKWLKGEEDPDYEVIPTRDEDRFIIKKRQKQNNNAENDNVENKIVENKNVENVVENIDIDEIEGEINIPQAKYRENDCLQEMLKELKLLREENERKRNEKLKKKEIKNITKKQLEKYNSKNYSKNNDQENINVENYQQNINRRKNMLRLY